MTINCKLSSGKKKIIMFCQEKKKINSCQLNVVVGKRENYVPWCHWRCPSKGQPAWFGETWWCVPVSPEEVRDPFRSTRRGWQTVVPSKKEKKEALDKLLFIFDAVILESNINIREYRFVYIQQHQGIQACLCIIRSILQVTQQVPPTCTHCSPVGRSTVPLLLPSARFAPMPGTAGSGRRRASAPGCWCGRLLKKKKINKKKMSIIKIIWCQKKKIDEHRGFEKKISFFSKIIVSSKK